MPRHEWHPSVIIAAIRLSISFWRRPRTAESRELGGVYDVLRSTTAGPMRLFPPLRACGHHLWVPDDVSHAEFCSILRDGCIIGYLPASCVRLFCVMLLMLYRWYADGFHRCWPKRAHRGIKYSMDDGFGWWNGLKWCITYNMAG